MDPDAIRAFAQRDWAAVAASKRAYWTERFEHEGWQPAWAASQGLLARARAASRDYPSVTDRDRDGLDHADLRSRLDRVAHAFTRR